jgi:hypothetical protein
LNISRWPKADTRWYLGVRCKKCGLPILFALDRTEGAEKHQPLSAGKLVLTCPLDTCRHQADYTVAAVSRFQKQPVKPNEAAKDNESNKGRKHNNRV